MRITLNILAFTCQLFICRNTLNLQGKNLTNISLLWTEHLATISVTMLEHHLSNVVSLPLPPVTKNEIPLYIITTCANNQVMRIKKVITEGNMS